MARKPTVPNDVDNSQKTPAVPIVAIGASAGGLVAVTELLQNLPSTTGLAYVYIQHLDPDIESRLAEVLSRTTAMAVLEAEHLMRVEPNHVYVIPPDKDLEVIDGVLTLMPRPRRASLHMPVDQFFTSLADRQKDGAVAVVLSGLDGDGTQGLKAIKAAGGFTFAQDDTAQFQSMPKSAVAEGVVDRVLPPAEIAKELERFSRRPDIFRQTALADDLDEVQATNEDLKAILGHLRRVVGVDFTHYKGTTVQRRVLRRTMLLKLQTLNEYASYLRHHADEATALYNDLLINVTTFFRDGETMDYLKQTLLPQLVRDKQPRDPLRIWIPACSTGQEAYSIAMLLLEVLGEQRAASTPIQIFATDLSDQAIAKARLGSYSRSEVADVSPERLAQFFTKNDDNYRISKFIRDMCVFAPHNLFRDPPFSRVHLISCRNLLIYLDNVLQRKALSTFHYALNPGGYLLLGKSETVGSSASLFTQVEKNYKAYARKNDVVSRAQFEMQPRTAPPDGRTPRSILTSPPERDESGRPLSAAEAAARRQSAGGRLGTGTNNLDQIVDELLLSQYVPASVVVNGDLDILQFRGSISLYLEPAPGRASLNLLKMARPTLTFELRSAVHKAAQSGLPVRKSGMEVNVDDKTHYVQFEAAPIPTGSDERLFLITFRETPAPVTVRDSSSAKIRNARIKELEDELAAVRRDMHAIIEEQEASNEELQSANEEIVSSNEELQSINEELETSKEEIESTNEELLTINQELQLRNEQLTEAHEFSETIFATLREATLVLDPVLRVRSANRTFYELFDTREEETEGRLIYELAGRQWNIPRLRELLDDVVTHNTYVRGFELTYPTTGADDRILLVNARRAVRQGSQEAILLAIEDITEHRQVQRLLAEREAWFHNIADNTPALTWVAGTDGRYSFFNRVWLDYTGRTLEDELVRGWALDVHSDDRDAYQNLYQQQLAKREPFQIEYRLRRSDGEYRWMVEHARPTFGADDQFTGYIGSSVDIHLQKTLTQELDQRVRESTSKLAEANNLMRLALNASRAGQGRWDWQSNATVWDQRGKEIIGFSSDEEMLRADGWLNRIHPDDRQKVMDQAQEAMRTGSAFLMEYRVIHDDGSVRYVFGTGQMKQDEDGGPLSSAGLVIDVTDLRQAEERIRERERQLSTLVENTPDVITRWDPNLKLLFANGAFADKSGQPLDALLGRTNAEMGQPGRIAGPYMDKLRLTFETGRPQEHYNDFPTPTGPALYFSRMVPEFGADGAIQSVLAIARDITPLRRAEEQARQFARNLQAVLNNSPASISYLKAVFDTPDGEEGGTDVNRIVDFRVVVANDKFAQLVSQPLDQLPGQSVRALEALPWDGQTFDKLLNVFKTDELTYEERQYAVDGQPRWYGISTARYDSGVVLTGLDITAFKQADQQRERLFEQLTDSQQTLHDLEQIRQHVRERGEFLRQTSHDLRGSFGVIQGAAQLLDMVDSEEERAQMLSMLQRNLRQVTQLLTQLLDYSRLESGHEQVNVAPFDAADLLRGLGENMQPLADERGLTLTTDGPARLPVAGDAVKVQRIAQNLLLNALKYTTAGTVTLRWQATDDGWQLDVTDTGPGLSPTIIRQLTDESASSDIGVVIPQPRSDGDGIGGEGIGLSIVKALVNLLGARLSVDSTEGVGTCFRVRFTPPPTGSKSPPLIAGEGIWTRSLLLFPLKTTQAP